MIQESARLVVLAVVLIVARAIWRLGTRFNLRRRDAIILEEEPPVLLLRSFAAHESNYEAALRVATFLMGQGDPSFRSRL
jgi:hypothetical protein